MRSKKKHNSKHEVRVSAQPQKFTVRRNADGTSRSISGLAVVWGALSEDLGGFRERIAKGAFTKSLRNNPDVLMYFGHDSNRILGRVSSGTLTVRETEQGLAFTCSIPDTSDGRDVITLAERGDLRSLSFGFSLTGSPNSDTWEQVGDQVIRTVNEATLFEISAVGMPAYNVGNTFDLRSIPDAFKERLNRSVFDAKALDDDDDSDCDCDPDVDPDCDCDADDDEDRDTSEGTVEVCSQCGQAIRSAEEQEEFAQALRLLLMRL